MAGGLSSDVAEDGTLLEGHNLNDIMWDGTVPIAQLQQPVVHTGLTKEEQLIRDRAEKKRTLPDFNTTAAAPVTPSAMSTFCADSGTIYH